MKLQDYLSSFPFIAITRGVKPAEAISCCEILHGSGFRVVETPLNSPEPYASIKLMAEAYGEHVLIGAGTVVTEKQVELVCEAGGKVVISPNCDVNVIKKTKECGLISIPGVVTPTEAFAAIAAGADALKLFPAEILNVAGLKALQAVLPPETMMIPVGGIAPDTWQLYFQAGAVGCGLGSSLYKAGITPGDLQKRANAFAASWANAQNQAN